MRFVLELQEYLGDYLKDFDSFDTWAEDECDMIECNLNRMNLLQIDHAVSFVLSHASLHA